MDNLYCPIFKQKTTPHNASSDEKHYSLVGFFMSQIFEEIARGEGRTLSQLSKLFPPARRGKPVSLGCILRWVLSGVKLPNGQVVRLEAARCSGRWLSTPSAIQRFLETQTPNFNSTPTPSHRTATQRQRASDRASRKLEALGI
jgi:hypothetical protein